MKLLSNEKKKKIILSGNITILTTKHKQIIIKSQNHPYDSPKGLKSQYEWTLPQGHENLAPGHWNLDAPLLKLSTALI